jgi:flagellar basal body-associated protein FliL
MANDNQGSRAFLAIVLGGIVLALVIAAYFMYGHKGDTGVKVEQPASEQPAAPPAMAPAESPAMAPAEPPAMAPAEPPAMAPAEPPAEETPAPEEAPAPQNP